MTASRLFVSAVLLGCLACGGQPATTPKTKGPTPPAAPARPAPARPAPPSWHCFFLGRTGNGRCFTTKRSCTRERRDEISALQRRRHNDTFGLGPEKAHSIPEKTQPAEVSACKPAPRSACFVGCYRMDMSAFVVGGKKARECGDPQRQCFGSMTECEARKKLDRNVSVLRGCRQQAVPKDPHYPPGRGWYCVTTRGFSICGRSRVSCAAKARFAGYTFAETKFDATAHSDCLPQPHAYCLLIERQQHRDYSCHKTQQDCVAASKRLKDATAVTACSKLR